MPIDLQPFRCILSKTAFSPIKLLLIVVEKLQSFCNWINCISWSMRFCIFDKMQFLAVRMHVAIVPFCLLAWKTAKLWMWKVFTTMPILCEYSNPTNWFCFHHFHHKTNALVVHHVVVYVWLFWSQLWELNSGKDPDSTKILQIYFQQSSHKIHIVDR